MKQIKHSHIKKEERLEISILLGKGYSLRSVAKALDRSPGTLSEEIRRNSVKGIYDPLKANHKAYVRRRHSKYQGKKINEDNFLKQYIEIRLGRHWSPDVISGKMRKEKQSFYASKTAIYEFLYSARGQRYCCHLYSRRYRPRKRKKKTKRALIPNRIGIEQRPRKVELNTEYGHYEGDTIVSGRKTGSKSALSVIYERKTKYINARKIYSLKPRENNAAIVSMEKELVEIKTMTLDNGIENVKHEELNIPTYFCDPYSAWQKGGVEQANKMIRRYIPKGSDISKYSETYVKKVINILNNTPRKSLGYMTPMEVMRKNNQLKRFEESEQCANFNLSIKKQTECSV